MVLNSQKWRLFYLFFMTVFSRATQSWRWPDSEQILWTWAPTKPQGKHKLLLWTYNYSVQVTQRCSWVTFLQKLYIYSMINKHQVGWRIWWLYLVEEIWCFLPLLESAKIYRSVLVVVWQMILSIGGRMVVHLCSRSW